MTPLNRNGIPKAETEQDCSPQQLRAEIERLQSALQEAESRQLRLAESEQFYRSLVELAADTILMGDHLGTIVGANQIASSLTGYPRHELLGQNISTLFSEQERQRAPLRYDLLQQGKVVQTERLLTRKDGTVVPVSMNSKMMPDGTYHTLVRDVTVQKALEEQLRAANRELEAFVYTVSHDLRTPLSPILNYPGMILEQFASVLDGETVSMLNSIEAAGTGMLSLIEDLLLFSSIGELQRPAVAIPVRQFLDEIVLKLDSELRSANVVLNIKPLPEVRIPKTFLEQVLTNLIVNALNYAGAGNRCIEIGGESSADGVQLYVRDYGEGIPATERGTVFEVFTRGTTAHPGRGTGLGLAIVKKIAKTCGGDAWCEETPGGGCTVRVALATVS